jgi:hypothetical protein
LSSEPEVVAESTVAVVRVFWALQLFVMLACALVLVVYRRNVVIVSAQPVLLWVILIGAAVSSASILLFSVEAEGWFCMGTVWLYGCGSMLMYAGLVCKMAKIGKVFGSPYALTPREARAMSPLHNLIFVAAMLSIEVVLLLSWTLVSPMSFNYDLIGAPNGGLVMRGSCYSGNDLPFVFALAAWHLVVLLYAFKVAVQTSHIHSAFSEGKYIRIAVFNGLQLTAIASLVLYFSKEPAISMLMRAGSVALHDVALLLILFGPKLQMIWYGSDSEGSQGGELLKNLESKRAIKPVASPNKSTAAGSGDISSADVDTGSSASPSPSAGPAVTMTTTTSENVTSTDKTTHNGPHPQHRD